MRTSSTVLPTLSVSPRRARPSMPLRGLLAAGLALLLSACAVGPDYHRPDISLGQTFKHEEGWKLAAPQDDLPRGAWWANYQDPVLNQLMEQIEASNLTLEQSRAQIRQAQASLGSTRSAGFPSLDASSSATRSSNNNSNNTGTSSRSSTATQYSLSLGVSWELDLWGRVTRGVEAAEASMQASMANLATTRLGLQAALARNYFQLRVMDEEKRLLEETIKLYERSLRLNENRYDAGVSARADIVQAQAQLENARVQSIDVNWQRAQLENAIALLLGQLPSEFEIPARSFVFNLPSIPTGLPSELLERRPDVAAAERQVAAANAQIGLAQAAYFPSLSLSANGGWRSNSVSDWLSAPARFWSLGPSLALNLFNAGRTRFEVEAAQANYDQLVAAYRLTALTALQEVENALVKLNVLREEQTTQARALAASRESLRLTTNQYEAGLIDFLSVVTVQTSTLAAERSALNLLGNRLTGSVDLIAALGGGWNTPPSPAELDAALQERVGEERQPDNGRP